MTNAASYVYEKLEDYVKLYPKGQDLISENHLCSLWMNDKSIVLVGNNSKRIAKSRPDFSKSLVYFDGGDDEFERYNSQFEHVVEVKVNGNTVQFIGQSRVKTLAIARSYGKITDGHVKGYILYDDSRPRINLIMNTIS